MTTIDIVFQHIRTSNGRVNLQLLTTEVLQNKPSSKWDQSHWSYYRTNITSPKGRYTHLFSDEIKRNLKNGSFGKVERGDFANKAGSSNLNLRVRKNAQERDKWPQWNTPTDEEQLTLGKIVLPYVKILDPAIVGLIAEDNNKNLSNWTTQLEALGIRPDIYLWPNSPVAFPGIRRHVGGNETVTFRKDPKSSKGEHALFLDDNSYPKQLWSFALRNHRHENANPSNYSLAHILDHKDHNSRNLDELAGFQKSEDKNLFAGLYTSCANSVYIPIVFLKPTDYNSKIRLLLIQVVQKYYAPVCNVLPHGLSFNLDSIDERWQLEHFPQPEVVGKVENTKNFLTFRNQVINDRIKALLEEGRGED